MKLRGYQAKAATEDKRFLMYSPRLGKTLTVINKIKEQYPSKSVIIITTNPVVIQDMRNTKSGFRGLSINMLGKDLYTLPKKKSDKVLEQGDNIIINNDESNIKKVLNLDIDFRHYVLVVDEVHKFRPTVTFNRKNKSEPFNYLLPSKRANDVMELSDKCYDCLLLSGTPGKSFKDYAVYFHLMNICSYKEFFQKYCDIGYDCVKWINNGTPFLTIKGYKKEEELKQLIITNFDIVNRQNEEVRRCLGESIEQTPVVFKDHAMLKKSVKIGAYLDRQGNEQELTAYSWTKKRMLSYNGFSEDKNKNAKLEWLLDRQSRDKRVTAFYSYKEDLVTLCRAFNKAGVKVYTKRGAWDNIYTGLEMEEWNEVEAVDVDEWVLLIQYESGSEGLTLHYLCSTLVHYSITCSYFNFEQSCCRIDGPVDEIYGQRGIYVMMTEFEKSIYDSVANGEDYKIEGE